MKNGKVIDNHGNIFYYKNDKLHRTDGPAVIKDRDESWFINGRLHRSDGPAIIRKDDQGGGQEEWWLSGKRHRSNGPAVITFYKNALAYRYFINDQLHREDGPAATSLFDKNGENYYLRNIILSKKEHENILKGKIALDVIQHTSDIAFRRMLIEYYGVGKFLEKTNTKPIYESSLGSIYKKELRDDEPLVVVKVKNSTPETDGTYKDYYIRIPPFFGRKRWLAKSEKIVREAIAWTFAMRGTEYDPKIES